MTTATTHHLTINQAAATTGWSPRMLRYVDQLGLVAAPRSAAGYRLYGPAELQRLRALRTLLGQHGLELGDVGFALRLRREPLLSSSLDAWFAAHVEAPPLRPVDDQHGELPDGDWLAFEQDKHQQLLQP